jgi:hypothetical protein
MKQLHDTTIEELLGEVFSVQSIPRCYKQNKSRVSSVVRQSPASKGVNMEAEEAMAYKIWYVLA